MWPILGMFGSGALGFSVGFILAGFGVNSNLCVGFGGLSGFLLLAYCLYRDFKDIS